MRIVQVRFSGFLTPKMPSCHRQISRGFPRKKHTIFRHFQAVPSVFFVGIKKILYAEEVNQTKTSAFFSNFKVMLPGSSRHVQNSQAYNSSQKKTFSTLMLLQQKWPYSTVR